mmetsp:Transcript_27014/g.38296  ORF Transcript_27014/g.38296 Transcript_27014/m.38296 type:complete len:443 (-) Transcript_27014:45-1373(-)
MLMDTLLLEPTDQSSSHQGGNNTTSLLRVAVIVSSTSSSYCRNVLLGMSNPFSGCQVTRVVFLEETLSKNDSDSTSSAAKVTTIWSRHHRIDTSKVQTEVGTAAFINVLKDEEIDGVYFAGEATKPKLVKSALCSRKHVVVDNPITQSIEEYVHLVGIANDHNCHLQDTTMFIHHYPIQQFLNYVVMDKKNNSFGSIQKIKAKFNINLESAEYVSMFGNKEISQEDRTLGCIKSLCRYCSLLGVMIFMKGGKRPVSATVLQRQEESPSSSEAIKGQVNPLARYVCRISFEDGCTLITDCSYVDNDNKSLQILEVHSNTNHTAIFSDFVFQKHGLACYRAYDKESSSTRKDIIKSGESVHFVSGPKQEVVFWRRFTDLCKETRMKQIPQHRMRRDGISRSELAYATIQSQSIVVALLESLRRKGTEVILPQVNFMSTHSPERA